MIQSMPIYIACLPNYWNKNNENAAQNNIVYNVIIYMTLVKSYHRTLRKHYVIQGYIDKVANYLIHWGFVNFCICSQICLYFKIKELRKDFSAIKWVSWTIVLMAQDTCIHKDIVFPRTSNWNLKCVSKDKEIYCHR